MFLIVRVAGMPGKTSMSGNEWSLEEIPAEEEILAGRGGSPGRPGRRPWAAGEAAAGRPGGRLGGSGEAPWRGRILLRASVGGTTLVAPNGPKRSQNRCFPEGAGPAPRPESQPPRRTPIGSTGPGLGYC